MFDKMNEILSLALELNPVPTRKSETGEKPTVFFRFSGHVGLVWVDVYPKGWEENQNAEKTFMLDLTSPCQDIDECIRYLKCLMRESEKE